MRQIILGLFFIAIACNSNSGKHSGNKIGINISNIDSLELDLQTAYGSNDSIFLKGYISDFAVDDKGRVIIAATVPGQIEIYVFSPDGEYLKTISRYGRGPGEFESISSIEIVQDRLYVFDPRLQKYAVFSTDDFTLMYDESIQKSLSQNDEYYHLMRGDHLHVLADNNLIMQFQVNNLYDINIHPSIRFYKIDTNGDIQSDKILELRKYRYYLDSPKPANDGLRFPFTTSFSRKSLFIHSDSIIYSAWTEDFLIKKYDHKGTLLDSIEFPFKKAALELDNLPISDWKKREIEKEEVPKTWPALYTIEADDKGRIWVATVTESDSTFCWYVINDKKEIIAQFEYAGSKENIFVRSKPAIMIKNGYFYEHQFDFDKNIDRIVKYKIQFKSR